MVEVVHLNRLPTLVEGEYEDERRGCLAWNVDNLEPLALDCVTSKLGTTAERGVLEQVQARHDVSFSNVWVMFACRERMRPNLQ